MSKCNILFIYIILAFSGTQAQDTAWSIEFSGGIPYNFPSPLVIEQQGEPTLRLTARYSSEPFRSPIYYVWRIGRWKDGRAWEFEFVHHKLYLDNKPPEITNFSISHGYNMALINRTFKKRMFQKFDYHLRLGAGAVLSHVENTVRGQTFPEDGGLFGWGYYITGPVLNVAVAKRFYLARPLYINTEVKFNPSVSWVPIQNGQAVVWNFPVAFAFGLGIDLAAKENDPSP
jgi:hypothetical protein